MSTPSLDCAAAVPRTCSHLTPSHGPRTWTPRDCHPSAFLGISVPDMNRIFEASRQKEKKDQSIRTLKVDAS